MTEDERIGHIKSLRGKYKDMLNPTYPCIYLAPIGEWCAKKCTYDLNCPCEYYKERK